MKVVSLRRRAFRIAPVLVACAALAALVGIMLFQAANTASAAPLRQGVIKAQAIQPLPPGFPMTVTIYDDSDLNKEIKVKMEDALKSKGYLVLDQGGALEFQVDTGVTRVDILETRPYLGEVTVNNALGAAVELNVWSSNQDSLLGGEGVSVTGSRDTSFHIETAIRDAETGRVLWQADAYGAMINGEPRSAIDAMVEVLADSVGERIVPRSFSIY